MACVTKRNGRYVIDCYDQYGQRYRKTLPKGTTKEEARGLLQEIEKKINRRTFLHEKKVPTFGEVAADWLKYKKPKIRISTWEGYDGHLRKHLSNWNQSRIDRITPADVEQIITVLQGTGLNIITLRHITSTINQVFRYAVRHKLIDYNPVRDAERPSRSGSQWQEERKILILTPEEIGRLLDAMEDPKYKTLFLVAVMTGMRKGEILGLKWSDVDFKARQIQVRRTFSHGRFFEPKTKTSKRKVDVSPLVVKALAGWKLQSGPNNTEDFVFRTRIGNPINSSFILQRVFRPALKKAGLPETIRFHDLRHCYASFMIGQGENIKYIQSQLGHFSPTVTLNIYSHLMKDSNPEAVQRLENTLFLGTGQNLVTKAEKGD